MATGLALAGGVHAAVVLLMLRASPAARPSEPDAIVVSIVEAPPSPSIVEAPPSPSIVEAPPSPVETGAPREDLAPPRVEPSDEPAPVAAAAAPRAATEQVASVDLAGPAIVAGSAAVSANAPPGAQGDLMLQPLPVAPPLQPAPSMEPRPPAPPTRQATVRRAPAALRRTPATGPATTPALASTPASTSEAAPGPPNPPPRKVEASAAEATFQARLLQAVQGEARRSYPASARLMGVTGQAAVSFEYRDGAVRVTGLAQSSGSPVLDHAALMAVQNASYPPPPAELAGRTLVKVVHVRFDLLPG